MRVRQADWAAQCPYSGIQDLPELLRRIGADGIKISDVAGLQAALDALESGGGGTVSWADITGKPSFGSAAYVSVSQFLAAPTAKTYQRGQIDITSGQREYPTLFSETMKQVPDMEVTFYTTDGTSDGTADEMFFGAFRQVDADGFILVLDHEPMLSEGYAIWRAKMPEYP